MKKKDSLGEARREGPVAKSEVAEGLSSDLRAAGRELSKTLIEIVATKMPTTVMTIPATMAIKASCCSHSCGLPAVVRTRGLVALRSDDSPDK